MKRVYRIAVVVGMLLNIVGFDVDIKFIWKFGLVVLGLAFGAAGVKSLINPFDSDWELSYDMKWISEASPRQKKIYSVLIRASSLISFLACIIIVRISETSGHPFR